MNTFGSTTFLTALALTFGSPAATAQVVEQVMFAAEIQKQAGNWSGTLELPQFDPELGELQSVDMNFSAFANAAAAEENVDDVPVQVDLDLSNSISVALPHGLGFSFGLPMASFSDSLPAFDGALDFGGASGIMRQNIHTTCGNGATLTASSTDLSEFVGAPSNVGVVTATVNVLAMSSMSASGNVVVRTQHRTTAILVITYSYVRTSSQAKVAMRAENMRREERSRPTTRVEWLNALRRESEAAALITCA